MSKELKNRYRNYGNVRVYNKDILKLNIEKIMKKNTLVFGNLPYNFISNTCEILKFKNVPPNFQI